MSANILVFESREHPGILISKILIKNYRITVPELSHRTSIPLEYLEKVLAGNADITLPLIEKLRAVFGVSADNLLEMQLKYNKSRLDRTGHG